MSVLQFTSSVALEVLDLALGVRDDGVTARGPVGRANFSVFIGELEGLHKSQSFINRPEIQRCKLFINANPVFRVARDKVF